MIYIVYSNNIQNRVTLSGEGMLRWETVKNNKFVDMTIYLSLIL